MKKIARVSMIFARFVLGGCATTGVGGGGAMGDSSADTSASSDTGFGAAFDGHYVYMFPSEGKAIARFDARNPPQMPSSYYGSFF